MIKREEQTQVLEMLDKDYISVKVCVILMTKFKSYRCVYMGVHLKTLTLKLYVDIRKVMQISFYFPDWLNEPTDNALSLFPSDVFKNPHPSYGSDKA